MGNVPNKISPAAATPLVDELGKAFSSGQTSNAQAEKGRLSEADRADLRKLTDMLDKIGKRAPITAAAEPEEPKEIALPERREELPAKNESKNAFPVELESKKDLRVDWLLGGDLPPAVQEGVSSARDFIQSLRGKGGRDPKPGETVQEYWRDVADGETPRETASRPEQEILQEAPLETRGTGSEIEEIKKAPELPEAVLRRWDQAVQGGAGAKLEEGKAAPKTPIAKTRAPEIPKKPSPERAQFMQTAAEPNIGRIIEQAKPAPPPADHLLFEIIKKHTNPPLTEEQWESVKNKPARDILNDAEYAAIKQSIAELQSKNQSEDIALVDGETMAVYMGRLLPRPGA